MIDAWFRDFWGMKREVAHFVLKCFWFQQMKAKHQSPRLLQKIIGVSDAVHFKSICY